MPSNTLTPSDAAAVGLAGRDGGKLGKLAELQIHVAEPHMGRIEDGHRIVCHMSCYYFMEQA